MEYAIFGGLMALTALSACWAVATDTRLACILQRQGEIMSTLAEFTDQITRLSQSVDAGNASIEGIQADIAALKGQLADGGLTASEESEVAAALTELEGKVAAQAAALSGIDAENPAPAPGPAPEAPVE